MGVSKSVRASRIGNEESQAGGQGKGGDLRSKYDPTLTKGEREHIRKRIPIKTLIAPFLRINCLTKIPVTDKRNTPNTIPTVCHAPNNIVLMSPPQPNNKIARNHTSGK